MHINWFLRWSRKSRKQIPAARALEEDNNVLIIRHANPEDQDIYVCTAENSAGAVHTSAKVQVNCKYLSLTFQSSIGNMGVPLVFKRQKIGLLGGSFDPAHKAHLHISKYALKYFRI